MEADETNTAFPGENLWRLNSRPPPFLCISAGRRQFRAAAAKIVNRVWRGKIVQEVSNPQNSMFIQT